MLYALWQGTYYQIAEFLYAQDGVTVTHVRLQTASGPTNPIPIGEVTIVQSPGLGGSGGSGGAVPSGPNITFSPTAPGSPTVGQVWKNTSTDTVAGVPPGNFAVWNGTAWVPVGTTQPTSGTISSAVAPTSPTGGQVWFNSSNATVNGIPSGHFGVWNGTAWVDVGPYQPSSSGVSSAATVILTGDVTGTGTGTVVTDIAATGVVAGTYGSATQSPILAIGADGRILSATQAPISGGGAGGVTEIDVNGTGNLVGNLNLQGAGISLAGSNINFDAYATDAEVTSAIAAHVSAPDPHAQYTRDIEVFGADYLAQATAPVAPAVGQIWRNTAGTTQAGIPAGNFAVWDGTVWQDRGPRSPYPAIIPSDALEPGLPFQTLRTNQAGTDVEWVTPPDTAAYLWHGKLLSNVALSGLTLLPITEDYDPDNVYNAGIFTAPVNGFYIFGATLSVGTTTFATVQLARNGTTPTHVINTNLGYDGAFGASTTANCTGSTVILLNAGNTMRFYVGGGAGTVTALATFSDFFAALLARL